MANSGCGMNCAHSAKLAIYDFYDFISKVGAAGSHGGGRQAMRFEDTSCKRIFHTFDLR